MTTPEQHGPSDNLPEAIDQSSEHEDGEYVDITGDLMALQADFIGHLSGHATATSEDDAHLEQGIDFINKKVGRDFSRLGWLKRGDELTVGGDISLVLIGEESSRYFINLGTGATLNGHALRPRVAQVPVEDAIPRDIAPSDVFANSLHQWTVAIELTDVIMGLHNPTTGQMNVEDSIGQHFRVYLPLVYCEPPHPGAPRFYVDRHTPTPEA